jgi:hypothetical protein
MSIVSSGIQHALSDINGSTDLEGYAIDHSYTLAIGAMRLSPVPYPVAA